MELTCKQPATGLADLPRILEERIIGQRFAIARISRAVQAAELGLNDTGVRPKGSFLLLGPTGVGKTESAKCFTEAIFGSIDAMKFRSSMTLFEAASGGAGTFGQALDSFFDGVRDGATLDLLAGTGAPG